VKRDLRWPSTPVGLFIIVATAGGIYGLVKIVGRHGPKLAAASDPVLKAIGASWSGVVTLLQEAYALTAILIFWAFLFSPIFLKRRAKRRAKPGEAK
jgi:hypothetical protein